VDSDLQEIEKEKKTQNRKRKKLTWAGPLAWGQTIFARGRRRASEARDENVEQSLHRGGRLGYGAGRLAMIFLWDWIDRCRNWTVHGSIARKKMCRQRTLGKRNDLAG
jgi:hypothetical protein